MNHIEREGDIIIRRSGGPDEWKAIHAIRDAIISNPQDLPGAQNQSEPPTADSQTDEMPASQNTGKLQP